MCIRDRFKRLEEGDEEAIQLWQWFRDESMKEFNKIYDLLEVQFDSLNGEAFYNDKMDEIVELLEEKHLLNEDKGAEIVDLSAYDLNPALIKKSDGATLYITRDLAAALYRKRTYDFKQSLYVVGNEQSYHFKQLKAVLKEMGFDWSDDMHHIPFGLITQGGKKLSTRKGKIVLLEEGLNEAIQSAKEQISEKNPDLENKDVVAKQVGVGAVIFHDLKNDRLNTFDFNLEEVVRFEGETGPYVQYTHARAVSLLEKAGFVPSETADLSLIHIFLGTKRMEEIIEELILDFDLVIFDMPPVATVTDAQILAAKTDGTLLVVRERKTKKQELLKAKELLQIAKANILGVVYNGTKKESDLTYYYQSFE